MHEPEALSRLMVSKAHSGVHCLIKLTSKIIIMELITNLNELQELINELNLLLKKANDISEKIKGFKIQTHHSQ